jgi:hypothetical protein
LSNSRNINNDKNQSDNDKTDKETDKKHEKLESVWQKQMTCYEIITFSFFYLSKFQQALDTLHKGFTFSSHYLQAVSAYSVTTIASTDTLRGGASVSPAKQTLRPLKRNRQMLKLLLLQNQIMLQMSLYNAEELTALWEEIATCADSFGTHEEYSDAGKVYKLAAEYFMSQSGRSSFSLSDKTSQLTPTPASQRANELNALAAKYTKKYTYHLLAQLETEGSTLDPRQCEKLKSVLHRQFISCIRVLFLQGVCAESVTHAQRHYEAAHTLREEYDR